MKKLPYEQQIKISMAFLIGGMLLTLLFRTALFFKVGIMAYGLMFFINPVLPKKAKVNRYSITSVRLLGAILILIGATGRL